MTTLSIPTESPRLIQVNLCDPDPEIRCEHCGAEVLDQQSNVVLMRKHALNGSAYTAVFCGPACANEDIRRGRAVVERSERIAAGAEDDPFEERAEWDAANDGERFDGGRL